jgi:hypothetical protein
MKRARGKSGQRKVKLNLKSHREAQLRCYERRLKELFRFRVERAAPRLINPARRVITDVVLEDLATGAPISKYGKVFTPAAEQNNLALLDRLVRAAKKKKEGRLRRVHKIDRVILQNWDVIEIPTISGSVFLPGLRCWTDRAAATLVALKIGEPSFSAEAYRKRRLRLPLHPEKLAVVTSAEFVLEPASDLYTVTLGVAPQAGARLLALSADGRSPDKF